MTGIADTHSRVVTIVFTDIEGSSRLWEQEPDRMRLALARHDSIVRAAIEQSHGSVIKTAGDGLYAAFEDPLDALLATLALQQGLADPAATNGIPFRVRCGVHAGAVERRDDDFFGNAVNRAARIMAAAHGGQILVSRAVASLVSGYLPTSIALRGLGDVRLKDLAQPEHVFQLVHATLRQDFPPLRSLESTPNNLPQQLTSFVGRIGEMREVQRLLVQTRVLTLLGPGGIGKTRLALQVAADVLDAYPDGVWFVDLAAITDSSLVADALARVLGLREEAGTPLTDTICRHVRSRQMLVLLDNCEHLLTPCANLVDALIHAGPAIRVLATSREPLRMQGEQVYPLPVLALPDPKADLGALVRADAVRLFVERARLQRPDFTVGEREASAVAKICTRLDGIPLALELAAARVGTLAVDVIATRLDDRFGLLTRASRTALPRHQALRALIDWSHDLLEPVEKALFARLSVFAGGWTLAAAETVVAGEGLASNQVLDDLDRLVAKSLVVTIEGGDRYRMLETIREYARGNLRASGDEEAVQARHHAYFLALAEEVEPFLRSRTEEVRWLRRLDLEHDNFKAALHWSLAPGRSAENAVRLCAALGHFWNVRGHWREGRDWFSAALRQDHGTTPRGIRAKAVLSASIMSFRLGEYGQAETWLQEALMLARETGNRIVEAGALNNLSNIVLDRGDFAQARSLLEQAVAINRELANHAWETINLVNLGNLLINQGDFAAAGAHLERALAQSRQYGNPSVEADSLSKLGLLEQRRGNYEAARALAGRSLAIYRELAAPAQEVEQLELLADASVAGGELAAAARYFEEALRTSRDLGYRTSIARCLEGMVALAVKNADHAEAAMLIGTAAMLRELTGVVASPSEIEHLQASCQDCQAALGAPAYAKAVNAGRGLSAESAMGAALDWLAKVV